MTRSSTLITLALLTVVSCATMNAVEDERGLHGVLHLVCNQLQEEVPDLSEPIVVLSSSQPLFLVISLQYEYWTDPPGLAAAEKALEADRRLESRFEPVALEIPPNSGQCTWISGTGKPSDHSSQIVVQIGPIIENPYSKSEPFGRFVRISDGGRAASWYWVAIAQDHGGWRVLRIAKLAVDDL